MRRGFTLLELAMVFAITGLLAGIALPRLARLRDGLAVDHATLTIVSAHRRARMSAIVQGRVLELTVAADSLAIRPRGGTSNSWRSEGPTSDGVILAGPSRVLTFSPIGLTMGVSNATFQLSRGAVSRTIVVSRLGRVRVQP